MAFLDGLFGGGNDVEDAFRSRLQQQLQGRGGAAEAYLGHAQRQAQTGALGVGASLGGVSPGLAARQASQAAGQAAISAATNAAQLRGQEQAQALSVAQQVAQQDRARSDQLLGRITDAASGLGAMLMGGGSQGGQGSALGGLLSAGGGVAGTAMGGPLGGILGSAAGNAASGVLGGSGSQQPVATPQGQDPTIPSPFGKTGLPGRPSPYGMPNSPPPIGQARPPGDVFPAPGTPPPQGGFLNDELARIFGGFASGSGNAFGRRQF